MPLFLAALLGGLVQVAATMAGRVLIALGIGYVTYQGLDLALDNIHDMIFANLTGLPAQTLAVMARMNIGEFINIQISAISARLVLNGLTSGAVTRMVIK